MTSTAKQAGTTAVRDDQWVLLDKVERTIGAVHLGDHETPPSPPGTR